MGAAALTVGAGQLDPTRGSAPRGTEPRQSSQRPAAAREQTPCGVSGSRADLPHGRRPPGATVALT